MNTKCDTATEHKVETEQKITTEYALTMYELQQEMFIYRTKHFWDVLTRMTILVYGVILFPYIRVGLKIDEIPLGQKAYCCLGMIAATFLFAILLGESARQAAIRESMDRIARHIGKPFEPIQFKDMDKLPHNRVYQWIIDCRIGHMIAFLNWLLQVVVALIILALA